MVEKIVNKLSGMYDTGKRIAQYGTVMALVGLSGGCKHFKPLMLPDSDYQNPGESAFLNPEDYNKKTKSDIPEPEPQSDLEKTAETAPSEKEPENISYLQTAPKSKDSEKEKPVNPLGYVLGGLIALGSLASTLYFSIWYPERRKKKQESE